MEPLSAVIITKNEEKNIGRTLEALKQVADEIIIVDSLSTDRTEEICRTHGVIFYSQEWLGYGPQKNFGIEKASNNAIINLDADEVLSDEAIQKIKLLKEDGLDGVYALRLVQYYFGKFMRHGLETPNYRYRIFDRREVKWDDTPVHERLVLSKTLDRHRLKVDVYHYSYHSLSHYLEKANLYTTLAANNAYKRGKRKYAFKMRFSPAFTFFRAYIFKLGFLDGLHGLTAARLNAQTNFLKYAKLRERILFGEEVTK